MEEFQQSFVMRSSKISLSSKKIITQFWVSLYATISELCQYHAKNPSKLNIRFQRYSYFSDAQNKKIQRKLSTIIGSILKSVLASSDSFCLITSHLFRPISQLKEYYEIVGESRPLSAFFPTHADFFTEMHFYSWN